MILPLSDHIADIELATNAHDMREPIAQALESLADDLDDLEIDATPTQNSTNLVESNGVYQMWSDLVDAETFLLPTDQILLGEKSITESGTYNAQDDGFDGYSHVDVDTSGSQGPVNLKPKYISQAGSYYPADDDCDGYSEVHVALDDTELESLVNRTINFISPANSIDRIGPYAFYSCNQLQSASFPVCTAIESYAFEGCTLLSTISASMCTEIFDYAFVDCPNLQSVTFQDLSYIPEGAFLSCASLSLCAIKSNGAGIFSGFNSIGSYAFANCYNFQGFLSSSNPYLSTLGVDRSIGDFAFYNCSSYSSGIVIFTRISGALDSKVDYTVGKCAFENCISLSRITLSASSAYVNEIRFKESAFKNCIKLRFVDIVGNSTNYNIGHIIIENNAFENCNHFVYANEPSSVYWNDLEIHQAAFRNVNLLPIPLRNVTYIGKYAFQNLLVPDEDYVVFDDSYYLGLGSHRLIIYAPNESTTLIDNYAFDNAHVSIANLHSCHLKSMAFANCQSLSYLQLYGDCSFADYAFDNCLSLSTMYIESPSITISEHAFANTYLDLYSTISDVNNKPFEPQILIRSQYFSIYASNAAWSKYLSYMKSGDIY